MTQSSLKYVTALVRRAWNTLILVPPSEPPRPLLATRHGYGDRDAK